MPDQKFRRVEIMAVKGHVLFIKCEARFPELALAFSHDIRVTSSLIRGSSRANGLVICMGHYLLTRTSGQGRKAGPVRSKFAIWSCCFRDSRGETFLILIRPSRADAPGLLEAAKWQAKVHPHAIWPTSAEVRTVRAIRYSSVHVLVRQDRSRSPKSWKVIRG